LDNDIAIMTTAEPIDLNEDVAAVCSPESDNEYDGTTAVVSGWGTLRSGARFDIDCEIFSLQSIT